MRAQAVKNFQLYRTGPMFLPPAVSVAGGPLAALTIGTLNGGTNWPGAGYDPEMHVVFAPASNAALAPIGLVEPPKEFGSDLRYVMGTAGQPFVEREGPGFGSAADAPQRRPTPIPPPAGGAPATGRGAAAGGGNPLVVQGLPLVKPPYGLLSAINLDRGEMMWQVAHGETPDNVRNHPALKGLTIPRTGQSGAVGLAITKTLVIMGDPQVTTTADHPRGAMLRAYDKGTGKEVGAVWMPAPQSGSPMTYAVGGKQYIIVAVSGGNYSGEYIAFSLPDEARTTN
jgi:quinoprotein glucose dehydrogenase